MKILIVGAGVVGFNLAEELSQEGHDISIIDDDEEKIKIISENQIIHGGLGHYGPIGAIGGGGGGDRILINICPPPPFDPNVILKSARQS